MDALEHEAWVIYVKAQQEEARRQAARAAEEKRRRQQQKQFERDLRDASFDGDLHTVQRLLEQQEVPISVNCKDANGEQAISEAASGGHPAVCALLLDYSADVNARGKCVVPHATDFPTHVIAFHTRAHSVVGTVM